MRTVEPVASVEAVMSRGTVLRNVVMTDTKRSLSRPNLSLPVIVRERSVEKLVSVVSPMPAQVAVVPQSIHVKVDDAASYQERGRGFQAGYEDGRVKGHGLGHSEGFEKGQVQGREDGLQAGLGEGRKAAQQKADEDSVAMRKALAERVNRLDALVGELTLQMDRRFADVEEEMLALCFEAVVRIVGEAATSPDGVRGIVRQAIVEARSKEAAVVHVSPQDLDFLEADADLKSWLINASRRVQWMGDDRVETGGCLVMAPDGGLDARLETQLARLAALFSSLRQERVTK
jgi:flagellar biosynthesis/type III secretory pathway protein FliH